MTKLSQQLDDRWCQLILLTGQLRGLLRHLGQHTEGLVLTEGPLC